MNTTIIKSLVLISLFVLIPGILKAEDTTRVIVFPFRSADGSFKTYDHIGADFVVGLASVGSIAVEYDMHADKAEIDICTILACENFYTSKVSEKSGRYQVNIIKNLPNGQAAVTAKITIYRDSMISVAMTETAKALSSNQEFVKTFGVPPRGVRRGRGAEKPADQIEVESYLGHRANLTKHYLHYERGRYSEKMSFGEYYYDIHRRNNKKGKVLAGVIAPIIAGVGVVLVSLLFSKNTIESVLLGMVIGVAATAGTIVTLVLGLLKAGRSGRYMRKLQPLVNLKKDESWRNAMNQGPKFDFGLMVSKGGSPAGAALQMTF